MAPKLGDPKLPSGSNPAWPCGESMLVRDSYDLMIALEGHGTVSTSDPNSPCS